MSSSTQDVIPQLDLGNTYGALFIGAILATILFGVTSVQAFIYFQTHKGTGMTLYKLAVIWLWTLDTLHLTLIVYGLYYYLVTNYANTAGLSELVWSSKLLIPVGTIIVWGVHLLYLHRIWIVSKGRSRVLPIIVGIFVVLCSGESVTWNYYSRSIFKSFPGVAISLNWAVYQCKVTEDLIKIDWALYSTLGTISLLDVLIASSLCYLLATSRTGFSSTDSFVTKLMGYTVSTGGLTSVFSLTSIITCAAMPNNFIFLGVEFIMVKLYVNSYIALLNVRYYTQADADNIDSSEFHARRDFYRPDLRLSASQDENFPAPRKSVFTQPDDEFPHLTRPVQATVRPIEVKMEMESFSSM
ncbi:uncharacterized protein EDB91DRAFT_1226279 [Suillus paluster]|uniref:uncharacterized protein n=1 Tax=Suillus paluster TaxID=48578 RepID=UPI001B865B47|nr:uncharacterized protein EDB91DRAFT_1226279 [Suillus paluster]KAG1733040.1 hypothetical protein EDB91DRAFT_1226279 [Suillus paluster]